MNKKNILIFILFVLAVVCPLQGTIPAQERAALIALYQATDGDHWKDNSGWKTPPLHTDGFAMPGTEIKWYGVMLFWGEEHIAEINLGDNNLQGFIPPQLENLSAINTIDLPNNRLTGNIPPELGKLKTLITLYLGNNQLSGNIPSQLENLENLWLLSLKQNQLSGDIPPQLGNLKNLCHLHLQYNQLTGAIPGEIGNMSGLEFLNLGNNLLTGSIPPQLKNIKGLRYLYLDNNKLTGSIPAEMGDMSNLYQCYLNHNQLSGPIPWQLGNAGKTGVLGVLFLYLNNNRLTGEIPSQLASSGVLRDLDLSHNQLTGTIPTAFGDSGNLQYLHLNSNKLSGVIPANFTNFLGLNRHVDLDISYNGVHTDSQDLRMVLNELNRGWEETQTVTPDNISALTLSTSSVKISWSPIYYQEDKGGYEIYYSTDTAGPWTYAGITKDKSASSFTVTGLKSGTRYYFIIKTRTDPHVNNQNTVLSEPGNKVSATTDSTVSTCSISVKSRPQPGVTINLAPVDIHGQSSGNTDFTRVYNKGTTVTLTAPMTFKGMNFLKWTIDGMDYLNRILETVIYDNHEIVAYYGTALELHVTTTEDHAPGSLREAITRANSVDMEVTIILPAGTYVLAGADIEDENFSGDLDIITGKHLTITGEGSKKTVIDGSQLDRVLHILHGKVSISGVTVQNGKTMDGECGSINEGKGEDGGGIYNAGILDLSGCVVKNNRTGEGDWYKGCSNRYGGSGGGIFNKDTLDLKDCVISNNKTGGGEKGGGGGGIYNKSGHVYIDHCTISDNTAGGSSGNGGNGGGIYNLDIMKIERSVIRSNLSYHRSLPEYSGPDVEEITGGGGIFNGGNLFLFESTVSDNSTSDGSGCGTAGAGGGIYNLEWISIKNSTISGNRTGSGGICQGDDAPATDGGDGGGIFSNGTIIINSSTICNNTTGKGGIIMYHYTTYVGYGAGIYVKAGEVKMRNTIVADNRLPGQGEGPDCWGVIESSGYNLVEDPSDCTITGVLTGNISGVDPGLGPLANNGGPTQTHALLSTSPALDAGNSLGLEVDQRGYPRPVDIPAITNAADGSDIGAYENQDTHLVPGITITAPTTGTNWPGGTTQKITWTTSGTFNTIDIEYTANYISEEESNWIVLVKGAPNTGSYTWTLPKITSAKCRLWMKGWGLQGDKVAWSKIFSITASTPTAITVTAPNGGEEWETGSKQSIKWSATGQVNNLKIEYSINGGTSWKLITSKTPNDGIYTWIIPDSISAACRVKLTDADNSSIFDVSNAPFRIIASTKPPAISLSRTGLTFGAKIPGPATEPQEIMVNNAGGGNLDWSVTVHRSWISCTPTTGKGAGLFTVNVDPGGLTPGAYTDTIEVSAVDAVNTPQPVTVTLKVYDTTESPFGSFDTPVDGARVNSSIPVTGWVLDEIGVESVKIYREEGDILVYIGDALFVEGARPDIEVAYPGYPDNNCAGWGYMMLTNFLPNGGNGRFEIHAIAADKEGNRETLGTRTIDVDNANAVRPFGAIDTPAPGAVVTGDHYINWGWALTPKPNTIPIDGTTITVWVDGVPLGHPGYNKYRQDVADLFPGYSNSGGAAGSFYLDTTKYENGVHTISWSVTDDAGNTDGIGSRFFTILNINSPVSALSTVAGKSMAREVSGIDITGIAVNYAGPLKIKKGFNLRAEPVEIYVGKDGYYEIDSRMVEPVVLEFPRGYTIVSGNMMKGGETGTKPVGSAISENIFSWLPAPGYSGAYEIGFIIKDVQGDMQKARVFITILSGK